MKKGLKFLNGQVASATAASGGGGSSRDVNNGAESNDLDDDEGDVVDGTGNSSTNQSRLVGKGNYAYEGGFSNEASEEMARIAFTSFFVCLLGDVRSYLTQTTPGAPPIPDRQKFMKHRVSNGDVPGSGMAILITNFLRGSMFDTFAEARREEVIQACPVPDNAPLFALVTNYHRVHKIAFSINDVRQSVRQLATQVCRLSRTVSYRVAYSGSGSGVTVNVGTGLRWRLYTRPVKACRGLSRVWCDIS
jgi:hypothetical protein